MSKSTRRISIFWLAGALCLGAAGPVLSTEWPVFHGDKHFSGYTGVDAPFDSLLNWTYDAPDSIFTSSPIVDSAGNLYIGTLGKDLLALSVEGNLLWTYHTQGNFRYSTPAMAPDGTLYIGGTDGILHAVYPNGDRKWNYIADDAIRTAVNIADDGTLYFGTDGGLLHAVNPDSTVKWTFAASDTIRSSPAIGPDGTVFFGCYDGYLYAVWPDGSERWRAATGDIIKYASPAVSEAGEVYFGSYDGFVYAVTDDLQFLWAHFTGNAVRTTPAISPDGFIYVAAGNALYALSRLDGSEDWHYSTDGTIHSSPIYSHDDDVVGFGSDDGKYYQLHIDGSLDWTFTVGEPIRSSPAPSPLGDIYVADIIGRIWAMGSGNLTAVDEPGTWPASPATLRVSPNPFRSSVSFSAERDIPAGAGLRIYDVQGRQISRLERGAGGAFLWDGRDGAGRPLPSGVYLYRLEELGSSGRVVLLR